MPVFVPYPAIERHGIIGDRRTAALVAADGTIDWLCLPNYNGKVIFGALLDAQRGGFWRVGPVVLREGEQRYPTVAPVVHTRWSSEDYELELVDAMLDPGERDDRSGSSRAIVRWLSCVRGTVDCVSIFSPSVDFTPHETLPDAYLWSSSADFSGSGSARLVAGDSIWIVLASGFRRAWSVADAASRLAAVESYWSDVVARFDGCKTDRQLTRSLVTIRLLEYAPAGSIVAAPTTSLPERIGGGWNADYRLTWIRDASLSISALAAAGDLDSARRFFDWLTKLDSTTRSPLQVTYEINGGTTPRERTRRDLDGYRGSKPVRFGNHAYRQHQHDKFGYLAECALVYLEQGGEWDDRVWHLLVRAADFVAAHWDDAGNGIWELASRQRYVSGRVMAWSALDRILRIADRLGLAPAQAPAWRSARAAIHEEVMNRGWSDSLNAFAQSFETEALDASALLIPIVGFLPPDHPRVVATVTAIAEHLTTDGFVYRFDPQNVPKVGPSPMGQYEGAFLPCTFWLATAFALLGRRRDAEDILSAVERVAGPLALFAEAIDPRNRTFLGNTPLLFSHVEYVRAVRAVHDSRR